MSSNIDTSDGLNLYVQSNYSTRIRIVISIVLGFISLLLSPYGIHSQVGEVNIDIPWSLIFPILSTMAFGWPYGVISALSGAALIPFFLWSNNGWANIVDFLVYLSFFISIGFVNGMDTSRGYRFIFYRYFIILFLFFIIVNLSYSYLYNLLLALNPININTYFEKKVLTAITVKECINFLMLTIFSDLLLRFHRVRRFFNIPVSSVMIFNNKIFYVTFLICTIVWMIYIGLSSILIVHNGFDDGHIPLAFMVIQAGGFVAARVIIYYTEKQLYIHNKQRAIETYLKLQFDRMPIAYIVWDDELKVKSWNPAAEKLFGYTESEVIGKAAYEIIVPKHIKGNISKIWYDLMFKGIESKHINENISKSGETIICNWTNSPIKDTNGKITEVISMVQDFTERVNAEKSLKESNELLSLFIKYSPIHAYIKDVSLNESRVLFASDNFNEMIGFESSEMIGKSMLELFPKVFAEKIMADDWRVVSERQVIKLDEDLNNRNYITYKFPIALGNRNLLAGYTVDITEQKQAQETLKESEANLNSLINNRNDAIWSIDRNYKFIILNSFFKEEYLSIFNLELKKGMDAIEIIDPELKPFWKSKYDLALMGQRVVFEFSVDKSNTKQFYEVLLNPIISDNTISGVSAISVNITDRKNAEVAIIESEQLFSNIFQSSPIAIAITLPYEGIFIDVNTNFLNELEYKREEVLGRTTVELGIFNDLNDRIRVNEKLKKYGSISGYECFFRTKTGRILFGLVSIVFIQIKGKTYQLNTVLNITFRKQAEIKLQESEKSYSGLFNSVTEAIYIQDEKGFFIDVNSGAEKMYGYSRDEIVGKTPEFLSAENRNNIPYISEFIEKTFTTGEPQRFEFWGKRKNGEVFPKEVVINKGKFFGRDVIIATARDISERKKAEEDLKRSFSQLLATLESTADGILVVDFNGSIINFNNKFLEIWNIPNAFISTTNDKNLQLYVLDQLKDPDEFQTKVKELYTNKDEISFDIIDLKDGRTLERYSIPQIFEGECVGRVWSFRDVTVRRKSEEALRESEYFFKETQRAGFIGSYKTDFIEGKWESSDVLDQIFGIDKDYCRSIQGWLDIIHPDDKEMMNNFLINEIIQKRCPFNKEYRIKRVSDGKIRWVLGLGVSNFDKNGAIVSLIGTIQDVTERKVINEALRLSEERFKMISESAEEWIWEIDENGKYTYSNQVVEKILGYRPEEIVGKKYFYDFFDPEIKEQYTESAFNMFSKILAFKDFENTNIHKNGSKVIFKTSGSPIVNDDGTLIGYRGVDIDITIQKRIETALLESEEKYRLTFITSPDAVNINRMDGTYVDINDGFTRLTGYTREDVIGISSIDIDIWYYPKDRKKLTKLLFKDGFVTNLESVFRCKDGTLKTALMSARIIQINNTPHILSITRDITERKLLEDVIAKSEEKYRKLFERSNDAIFIIDKISGKYLDANKAAERITGYSLNELKKLSSADITSNESYKKLSRIRHVNKTIDLGEIEYYRPNGTSRNALISIVPLSEDKVYGIARDITDRKQYEDALSILSSAVDQSQVSVVITDTNGLIEYVNPKFAEITGYNLEEVVGKKPSILKSGYTSENDYKKLWDTITSGKEWRGEFYNLKKNGDKFWESALISPITSEIGKITHFLAVKEDITEKKESERRILSSIIETEEKERNRFSRELHDGLGPLLSTIKLYFQWISETEDQENKKLIIEKGERNINEAIETIREVSNNLSPRTLNSFGAIIAIKNFVDNVNNAHKIFIEFYTNIERRFEKNVETVLYRVTSELINNTLKYAKASKSVINIFYSDNEGILRLTYTDNGKGFSKDNVFSKGKGMGLINIEQRVNTLEGKFKIESSEGNGVFVEIELPMPKDRIIA